LNSTGTCGPIIRADRLASIKMIKKILTAGAWKKDLGENDLINSIKPTTLKNLNA